MSSKEGTRRPYHGRITLGFPADGRKTSAVHVFGLTCGISSGKSFVAARFAERGVAIVDADALARDVPTPGSEALDLIVVAFGSDVLASDGTLDRKALARKVFGDPERVARLNAIMHPRIYALAAERSAGHAARGEPLVCYEAALLVENGLAPAFRPLVVVAASPEAQLARAMKRDGASESEVRARLDAQLPLAEKARVADIVIDNDRSLDALRASADSALKSVCQKTGVDPRRYGLGAPP